MKTGIGIDTGGTYTDIVIYDFGSRRILGSAKALTTKENLSIGILEALDKLPIDLLRSAEVISLSTTLATNACVEDKGGDARLIFFGGDKKVIDELGKGYGLPASKDIYIQDSYTRFSGECEREPDWELFSDHIRGRYDQCDGAAIVEIYAMKNGAVVENKAKALFSDQYDIPVICGHELFSELNCLQRASSALLNARLFPIIKEFLAAIKTSMEQRGIKASVVIVRSDGSLMSEEFAGLRPVETLLCGPAASVIGSRGLSSDANSVIVDMGGTTTDIALIKENVPVTAVDGVSIGKWKTFVNGLYVKTFGLGGDSAVHYHMNHMFLEEYRVVPLSVAAKSHPQVITNLKGLHESNICHTLYLHEHYILNRDISGSSRYTEEEQAFCRALSGGPLILKAAAEAIGQDIYTLDMSRLLREGVVQLCGLTPTDIMHIKGDFTEYSKEAALLAAEIVARNVGVSVDTLCDMVYDEVKRKIYVNVVKVLLENKDKYYMKNGVNADVSRFINESYEAAKAGKGDGYLSMMFDTGFSLVGIGAPVHLFLNDVAALLNTKAVIPEFSEVANALGAIIGNVSASCTVSIKPNYTADGISGYNVFGGRAASFETIEEAEEFAVSEAKQGALDEAKRRGAAGEITVVCDLETSEFKEEFTVYLGTEAVARAVGTIGL